MTVDYTDENDNTYEVTFEYDPDLYGEEDPSQSPWHYITVESVTNPEGKLVELDEDDLYEMKQNLWKEYKYEL